MAVTVADIAKRVGVSTSTAADILRGRPGYSERTRRRILGIARELDFVPNHMARSLLTRQSKTIGILGNLLYSPVTAEMLQAMARCLKREGYMPLFTESSSPANDEQAVRELRGRAVDGMILRGDYDSDTIGRMVAKGTPCVAICTKTASACPCVVPDRTQCFADGVRWLFERGHRRIAFLGVDNAHAMKNPYNMHRLKIEGYLAGMADAGLSDKAIVLDAVSDIGAARTFVAQNADVFRSLTAVMACNDHVAIETITGLSEIGLKVPDDCSVIGFDDTSYAQAITPRLTTFQPRRAEIGATAAEMVLKLIEGHETSSVTIIPRLIERESTRAIH